MTVAELRKLGVVKKPYNGMQAVELSKVPINVEATATLDMEKKLDYHGIFCIDRTVGSYRYGDQLMFSFWTKETPVEKQRVNNHGGYHRVQIAIPIEFAVEFLEKALQKLWLLPPKETV